MILTRMMFAAVFGIAAAGASAAAPDWSSVPAKDVTLFYPGQASLEWALTKGAHRGAVKFKKGKPCAACHTGEEKEIGGETVTSKKLEPTPIPGKPGWLAAKVQVARDAKKLYVRVEFSDAGQPNAKMGRVPAKVMMMLAGADVPEVAHAGCWAACHNDSAGMPKAGSTYRTLYLGEPRKPGAVLEYWEAVLKPDAAVAESGTISDKRRETRPTVVAAEATYKKNGVWSVILSRPLDAGAVSINPGKHYTIAFAIDAGHTRGRFHYVSLERTLALGEGTADFIAK